MCAGYISPTLSDPQVAFSIWSLELLHSLFHAASNFSIQSFSCLLTDMHKVIFSFLPSSLPHNNVRFQVAYQPYLRTQVSLAFDIFFHILSHLSHLVNEKMGNTMPDHRLRTSCPACHHWVGILSECLWNLSFSRLRMSPNFPSSSLWLVMGIHPSHVYTIILKRMHAYSPVTTISHITKLTASRIIKSIFVMIPRSVCFIFCLLFSDSVAWCMEDQAAAPISDSCLGWQNAWPMPVKSKSSTMQVMDETGIYSVICHHGIVQSGEL